METLPLQDTYSQLFLITRDARRRTNFVSILKSMLQIEHVAAVETFEPHHLYPIKRSRWLVIIDRSLSINEALHEIELIRRSDSAVDILLINNTPLNCNYKGRKLPDATLPENFTINDLFTVIHKLQIMRKDTQK